MEDRYHYSNGSVAVCERRPCGFPNHMTLADAVATMRNDETNALYSPQSAAQPNFQHRHRSLGQTLVDHDAEVYAVFDERLDYHSTAFGGFTLDQHLDELLDNALDRGCESVTYAIIGDFEWSSEQGWAEA